MKRLLKGFGVWVVVGIAAVLFIGGWGTYNDLVAKDEAVTSSWSEVKNQLKRRNDLIPNLVAVVKGYAGHEHSVFAEVTSARAKIGQVVNVDVSKLANSPFLQKQLLDAQQGLNASLGRLLAVAENYPQLKADRVFINLQDELSGTENRVAVARNRAIKNTQDFNTSIRGLFTKPIARAGGFTRKEYFDIPESEQAVPVVNF